jgi:hypothetical protein
MPIYGLAGLSEPDDKRHAMPTQKLEISACYELIMANCQRIVDAFGRSNRPRSRGRSAAGRGAPHPRLVDGCFRLGESRLWVRAGGNVCYGFRGMSRRDAVERRTVVAQTKIEPEDAPQSGRNCSGWTCDGACRWMLEQVGHVDRFHPA